MDIDVRQAMTQNESPNAMRVTVNVWPDDTRELREIITEHFPAWAELFASKNSEYGSGSAFELGQRGQFSDIYRKIIKLKRAMWDEDESVLTTESVDEIIMDMIGHCFLTLEMRKREREKVEQAAPLMTLEAAQETAEKLGLYVYPGKDEEIQDGLIDGDEDRELGFYKGQMVRFKQHLGKGQPVKIVNIRDDPGGLVLGVTPDGIAIVWVHPSWMVPDGQKSEEEKFIENLEGTDTLAPAPAAQLPPDDFFKCMVCGHDLRTCGHY